MVSQVRVGVADCDRKRDHCAEPTKLIRLIARVSGEYGGKPLIGDDSVRCLVLSGS
jgi:hypothetical protein